MNGACSRCGAEDLEVIHAIQAGKKDPLCGRCQGEDGLAFLLRHHRSAFRVRPYVNYFRRNWSGTLDVREDG